jgi:hypothetical protein
VKRRNRNILLAVVGVFAVLLVVVIAVGAWFFTSVLDTVPADAAAAERAVDDVRERFGGVTPVMELRDREMVLLRERPQTPPAVDVRSVRVMAWDPEDERLVRLTLPMWALRLTGNPIRVSINAGEIVRLDMSLTAEDVARYGSTLLVDHADPGGARVLAWTE